MSGSHLPDFIALLREHPQGLPVQEIAHYLGIARQSVYRLRDRVHEVYGIWLEEHDSHPEVARGWLRLPKKGLDVQVSLIQDELEALLLAVKRLRHLTPLAQQALQKLAAGQPLAKALNTEPILYSPLADEYPEGLFGRVAQAIRERQVAEVTYKNAKGQTKTYRFDAYTLIARDPHLYLVGANHNSRRFGHDPVKDLRLDQVLEFKLTPDHFAKSEFDVRTYAASRFRAFAGEGKPVCVRVQFSPEKAQFIRRTRRHPTQEVKDREEGGVVWEVEVPISEDLVHWIVSYGPHARVLEPEELRRRVVEWARGAVEVNDGA